jgi:ribosomal protein S16
MLVVRLRPVGRKNYKIYRVVVSEKRTHVTKGQKEILGFYDPNKDIFDINVDRIKYYVEQLNLETSPRVRSLLKKKAIIK